eukprot:NODE_130_length_18488_cov_0.389961.p4 type:complete len:316 gc:universal NODE_130_length_18488_cov_0.389961:97-1044(+)
MSLFVISDPQTSRLMTSEIYKRKREAGVFKQIEDTVTDTVGKVQRLFHFSEMNHWVQDNKFIHNGYRMCDTYMESWKSLTYWHNETMNIYTHLISGIAFVGIICNIWLNWKEPKMDKIMFSLYCICATKCFFMSSLYHLHCHQCYKTYRIFMCLDFAGISVMIMGSCILMTYYIYYCDPFMQFTWLTLSVLTSLVGILGPFFESFSKHPWLRAVCYTTSGAFSGLPVAMHILAHAEMPFNPAGILFFLGMILCYIGGAAIYVYQVPERFYPGYFDYLFHSHQIWHCFVTAAAVLFYWCALDMMYWREANACKIVI